MRIESILLIFIPLWAFAQASLLSLGDYQVGMTDRGVEILWRGHKVITGSYLRIARPNYQGADYLYFRSGEAKVEGNKLEVRFSGESGKIEGIYTIQLKDEGVILDLALKLNDPTLPPGPREYAVGIFPAGLVEGGEYEVELPLGKGEGRIPKEAMERAVDYGPAFRSARLQTNEGFDILIKSLSGTLLYFHDARNSDWFSEEDRRIWIWAPGPSVGQGVFLNTTLLLSCQDRGQAARARKGEVVIVDKGEEIPVKGIVAPADSPIERAAAKELASYIERMTDRELPILEKGNGKGFIFVGKVDALPEGEFKGFKDDGFIIRQEGGNVYLVGKGYRGTIFAVYRFLELIGCRFLAREEEVVPKRAKLKISLGEIRENPVFEWRYFDTTVEGLKCYLDPGIRDEEIQGEKVPAVLGAPFFWHHPMNGYLPLDKFRDTHPEYYCLINGKRWPELKQYSGWDEEVLFHPCVSNPEVRKVILDTLLPLMDSHPDARYFTVHAGDSDFWCQCERCSAMDVDPNNKADRMVQFTNAIAEVVARHHPDKFVTMLAYVKAYHPPVKFSPLENVLVWFCPIHACQIHPWRAPCNKDNYDVLVGWIQKHPSGGMGILTFDYPMNYIYHIAPFPAMFAYLENLKLYERLHIRGLYICGIPDRVHLAHLFSYVVPRMMWNPEANPDEFINDFLRYWFGPAAPQMKRYLVLLRELVESGKADFNPWQMPPKELFTQEFLKKIYNLFEEGEKACEGQEIYLRRLWKEKAGILYTDLLLYGLAPQLKEADTGLQLVQPTPEQLKKLAELLKICLIFGWDSLQEGLSLQDWVAGLLGYSPKTTGWFHWWEDPIMKQFMDDPVNTFERLIKPKLEMRSIRLENDAVRVDVIPSLGGRIRSIFFKKHGIELLWKPSIPVVYSGTKWRDFGGYEEYIGEELGAPGWKEKYEAQVAPDGQSVVLTCNFPNGLVLRRRISLLSSPTGIRISSTLRNEGSEVVKGVILRTHPELIFAMDAGPVFISRDLNGNWRNIEVKEQDNFIDKELFAGGIIAVVDYKRAKGLIHEFNPQQIDRYMIYKGKDFYNLELFSPKRDLAGGEEIEITQGFFFPEIPTS
ncbi:DUF4838 domain-containing protein [bacterium]|nr:DUF4838 domain-containing protein [bacterium]